MAMNNQEREAFEDWFVRNASSLGGYRPEKSVAALAFQGGAAYQREQVKGLVEALEKISALTTHSAIQHWADEALATYKAAQEGK